MCFTRAPRRGRGERGQASVEAVAVLPAVLLLAALVVQLALAGHAAWACANAARVAARAEAVGEDASGAARSALPKRLERGLSVRREENGLVAVRVRVPLVLPLASAPSVSARARLQERP
jgi:TadE-like protein